MTSVPLLSNNHVIYLHMSSYRNDYQQQPLKNQLLGELRRLNREGMINDEEYVVLRRFIASEKVSADVFRQFEKLFVEKSKPDLEHNEK